jgi:Putative restriction endonuclease
MQHVVMPEVLIAERRRLGLDKQDEMWDGVLHMNLPGNTNHQRTEMRLALCLEPLARQSGLELLVEAGLFDPAVEENKSFWVPDLVVFPPSVASDRGVEGRATLAIEIRSPGDESFDKIPHYSRIGVAELLIIDRDERTVRRWVAHTASLAEVPAGEDGWHQLAALPAALRGGGGSLGVRIGDHIEVI